MKTLGSTSIMERKVRTFLVILLAVALFFATQASFAQKIDVYSRPLQKEPSQDYDAIHYRIKLRFNEDKKAFWGENTITLRPLKAAFQTCILDAETFTVTSVQDEYLKPLKFQQADGKLTINLGKEYDFEETLSFTVFYYAEKLTEAKGRSRGINFVDESPDNPSLILARSFPTGARHWFPCYDHPHDKVTHEIIATVPHEYKVLSNGRLVSATEDKKNKSKTFHWAQELPHSTYLTTLAAGAYQVVKDSLGSLPINYWFYKSDEKDAMNSFHRTPEIIELFNREYGYNYPWAKYDQVTVPGGGGAECTSATLLGQRMIHDERGEQDFSSHGWLICHEAAHQWWGDLVTCRDWGHTWINESFGTYSEIMFALHDTGEDEAAVNLLGKKNQYLHEAYTRYMRPIVFHRWERPGQNFDRHTYQKGAVIIHLMRWILGEKPFHKTLSHFLHKHAFQPVDTHDFLTAIKEATGQNLDWFFDQWLLSPGHPIFNVSYTWDKNTKKLTWRIVQTQDIPYGVPTFKTPVILGIVTPAGKRSEKVWLNEREEVFTFDCDQKPLMVRFDEGNHILKEWAFKKTVEELLYQLNNDDVIGRMWAVSQLSQFDDNPRVAAELIKCAKEDPFWAVRRDALYILGGYRGVIQMGLDRGNIPWTRLNIGFKPGGFLKDELINFFKEKAKDENSKVRAAALWALGNLKKVPLVPFFKERFANDDSYRAQAAALISIGKCGSLASIPFLKKAAQMKSPLNILKRAADWALEQVNKSIKQLTIPEYHYDKKS